MTMENEISATSIRKYIDEFKDNGQDITHRYSSFDLCYNYFTTNRDQLTGNNMEMSCYVLWSYLASWGMLRNSFLLQKSPAYLKDLIIYIQACQDIFEIDVSSYDNEDNRKRLIKTYTGIAEALRLADPKVIDKNGKPVKNARGITLVTKIMLGVFGCVPAYDRNFTETFKIIGKGKGFKSNTLSESSLIAIFDFYKDHKPLIDSIRINCPVKTFDKSHSNSGHCYTIAKIIDMYGFQQALKK